MGKTHWYILTFIWSEAGAYFKFSMQDHITYSNLQLPSWEQNAITYGFNKGIMNLLQCFLGRRAIGIVADMIFLLRTGGTASQDCCTTGQERCRVYTTGGTNWTLHHWPAIVADRKTGFVVHLHRIEWLMAGEFFVNQGCGIGSPGQFSLSDSK